MAIAFITGATAGFGKATAIKFAQFGWDVIITGRRQARLDQLEEEIINTYETRVFTLSFDVRNNEEVVAAIQSLPHEWKKIDVLVNNAGLASGLAAIQDGELSDWETMIDTNVKGLLYVTKAILPFMTERKSGHIINIGSIAGKEAYAKGNVYCATKHAVDALSKSMRIDLLPFGIKVTAINPGAAETEFSIVRFKGDADKAAQVYKGYEPLKPEDIAEVIYFAASRPAHVVLNDIIITPLAQANTSNFLKNTN
ncbi:MAG: SDR family NAD(P)-dependent oxidoreductase [Bacteroidetes bacterium]|nr:SDR family NAD(P)-dependent oxidoreductase [Bacteroidota bacterium]MBK7391011.1 SDR family NAD(P)-dependent oxidoreductase [Bacteroidota bacterium]MBK7968111.1 SDR family NAD(P)-dependent oxidoreductase [Bacteroidota bacterium]MBK9425667.1 SDR family NAD(P)-dependent oxidoreductase [Bacteroidota bacterium]